LIGDQSIPAFVQGGQDFIAQRAGRGVLDLGEIVVEGAVVEGGDVDDARPRRSETLVECRQFDRGTGDRGSGRARTQS